MRGDLTVEIKKNNSGEVYIIIVAILFSLLMFSLCLMSSCSNKENNESNTQIVTSTVKDYGTEYRYINVLSNGKSVWQLKGTLGVVVDNDTVIITTTTGKKHIFVNADVIIRQIDKNEASKSETSNKEESSKVEESKVEGSKKHEESSRLTSESSISKTSYASNVSQASYTSSVASH